MEMEYACIFIDFCIVKIQKNVDNFAFLHCITQLLDRQGVSFCTRTTFDDNAITNAIDIYKDLRYHNL